MKAPRRERNRAPKPSPTSPWLAGDSEGTAEGSSAECPKCGGKIIVRISYREGRAVWFQCVRCAYTPTRKEPTR
jgi:predicted RNA-binding Zn-ribbon protein involved in translation (DUF1610 family)